MSDNEIKETDRLWSRLDKIEDANNKAHESILTKLDAFILTATNRELENNKKYVGWKVFILIIPIILGSYGFAWGWGSYILSQVLKHIGIE